MENLMTIEIRNPADFRNALAVVKEESAQWKLFLGEIHALHAWTANGRTPLLAERVASKLSFTAARELEGVSGPPELIDHLERLQAIGWFFNCWPANEREMNRGGLSYGVAPSADSLDRATAALRSALIEAGDYDIPRPPESAFQSDEPCFRDTMSSAEWIRWVLLVKLDAVLAGNATLPATSQLCGLLGGIGQDPAAWGVLYALGRIDDLFIAPVDGMLSEIDSD